MLSLDAATARAKTLEVKYFHTISRTDKSIKDAIGQGKFSVTVPLGAKYDYEDVRPLEEAITAQGYGCVFEQLTDTLTISW